MSGRTTSSPATSTTVSSAEEKILSNSYSAISDDQVRSWSCNYPRAPPPARFVRKQKKVQTAQGKQERPANSNPPKIMDIVENVPATVEIDADLWTCSGNGTSGTGSLYKRSIESKYYIALRQYVAEVLTKSEHTSFVENNYIDNDSWDVLLRVMSV